MSTARRLSPALLPPLAAGVLITALAASGDPRPAPRPAEASHSDPSVRAAARRIDELVLADLSAHGVRPNDRCDDATFVRRAYLQIVGRVPSLGETREFLASKRSTKRSDLVDSLLDSPGHVSHAFHFWADLLRAKSQLARQTSGEPFMHWLKESIAANRPYDDMVRELLTASGSAHARGNGATGLLMRDRGMPEDSMANTLRVFLGTRIECAQCHNHPFDKWTQKEFFEMVAFAGGIGYDARPPRGDGQAGTYLRIAADVRKEHGRNGQRALRQLMRPITTGLRGTGTGLAQLPKDYQYDDAKPQSWVTAHTMFGEDPGTRAKPPVKRRRGRGRNRNANRNGRGRSGGPEIDSRSTFAAWLTSSENPRFTRVVANRLWKRAFGRGVVEPVDDFNDDTQPVNPKLLDYLEALMVELDYDLRAFERVLYSTATWQREATRRDVPLDETYRFPGPLPRRLSAEQLWDSLLTLALEDVDATLRPFDARAERVYRRFEEFASLSEAELLERVDTMVLRYTDPTAYRRAQQRQREKVAKERRAKLAEARREARPLQRALGKARRAGDDEKVAELTAQIAALRARYGGGGRRGNDRAPGLVRASEMPSPAPDSHFLRQFGQSDRDQIDGSNAEADVTQALALLNGVVDDHLLPPAKGGRTSAVLRAVSAATSADKKIETAYLATLNRRPTRDELSLWRRELRSAPERASRDLIWALVNTHEFRFVL